jgi:hypothetical protein
MARPPAVPAAAVGNIEGYSFVVAEDQPEENGGERGEIQEHVQPWQPLLGHDPWQGTLWEGYCSRQTACPIGGHRCTCPLYMEGQRACKPSLFQQIDTSLRCFFHQPRCSCCDRHGFLDVLGICTHSKSQCPCRCSSCCQAGVSADEAVSAPPNAVPTPEKSYFSVESDPEGEMDSERAANEDADQEFNPPSVSGEDEAPKPAIPRNVVPDRVAPTAAKEPSGTTLRIILR